MRWSGSTGPKTSASWCSAVKASPPGRWSAATSRAQRRCASTTGAEAGLAGLRNSHRPALAREARDAGSIEKVQQLNRQVAADARAVTKTRRVEPSLGCIHGGTARDLHQFNDRRRQEEAVLGDTHQVSEPGGTLQERRSFGQFH